MAVRLVPINVFQAGLVSGLTSLSRLQSSGINLTLDVISVVGLLYQVSSVVSTADVGFFYGISRDGVSFSSYTAQAAILASTFSTANSGEWFAASFPSVVAPYIQITAVGTGSNPVDTKVWAQLLLRMD